MHIFEAFLWLRYTPLASPVAFLSLQRRSMSFFLQKSTYSSSNAGEINQFRSLSLKNEEFWIYLPISESVFLDFRVFEVNDVWHLRSKAILPSDGYRFCIYVGLVITLNFVNTSLTFIHWKNDNPGVVQPHHATETRDKRRPDEPLGSCTDFFLPIERLLMNSCFLP